MREVLIKLLQTATSPTQKEWIRENGWLISNNFFDYMQESGFLKPIEEGEDINAYIKHIAKEEDCIQAFIDLIKENEESEI